jgi:CheY-like chemotaxis protein
MGRREPPIPRDMLAGVHVLVVEDSADSREIFKMILEYAGALVSLAGTAEQALSFLDHVVPDVLVSDIAMPTRDGVWLIGQIRARNQEGGREVPALAVTAADEHEQRRIRAAGFQRYLRKPVDPWEFCNTVASLSRLRA